MPDKFSALAQNIKSLGDRIVREATRYSPSLLGKIPNSEIAMEMAGTRDKKSPEYKAAMRNLQRYAKGDRKPKEASKRQIERAVRKIVKEKPERGQKLIGSGTVYARGMICYSRDCHKRTVKVVMSASAMAEFLSASRRSSAEGEEVLFKFYDVPGMSIESGKVSVEFD